MKLFNVKKKTIIIVGLLILATSFLLGDVKAEAKTYEGNKLATRGATIWPIENVSMFDMQGEVITTIPAGTPLRVLSSSKEYFKVFYERRSGYILNDRCMINLPDCMQEELLYDITNSYFSIYKIHGYGIDGVTGEVLYPYAKVGEDEYLVPLLYPVALKLYDAEEEALSLGYTLKIYDAYRPNAVTKEIYDKTTVFVNENPVFLGMMTEPVKGVSYGQSNFLAKGVSNHNYGVAVDLTIVDLESEEELKMQSDMHELSTQSILALNNDAAELLSDIMMGNGFGNLVSEWWHFQIRDARKSYASFQVRPIE